MVTATMVNRKEVVVLHAALHPAAVEARTTDEEDPVLPRHDAVEEGHPRGGSRPTFTVSGSQGDSASGVRGRARGATPVPVGGVPIPTLLASRVGIGQLPGVSLLRVALLASVRPPVRARLVAIKPVQRLFNLTDRADLHGKILRG